MLPIKNKQSLGFTYIGLLLIVAIAGIALSGVGIVWKTEMQRENEKELRFVGQQYVAAIASYYECKICGLHQYPKTLNDLLQDKRATSKLRHLRKLYRDPMTKSIDWGLVKIDKGIVGIYSKSLEEPLSKPYLSANGLDFLKDKNTQKTGKTSQSQNVNNQNNVNRGPESDSQNNTQLWSTLGSSNKTEGIVGLNIINSENKTVVNKVIDSAPVLKSKLKPSYQDWKFVYSAAQESVNNTVNSQKSTPDSSASQLISQQVQKDNSKGIQEDQDYSQRVGELCDTTYQDDLARCDSEHEQSADRDMTIYKSCKADARERFNQCQTSLR